MLRKQPLDHGGFRSGCMLVRGKTLACDAVHQSGLYDLFDRDFRPRANCDTRLFNSGVVVPSTR